MPFDWRTHPEIVSLDKLVRGEIRSAFFKGFGRRSTEDGMLDPKLGLLVDPYTVETSEYFGFLLHQKGVDGSGTNEVRRQLNRQQRLTDTFNVQINGVPINGDPRGPYLLRITSDTLMGSITRPANNYSADYVNSVVSGDHVFYGVYYQCERGEHLFKSFLRDGQEVFGVLRESRLNTTQTHQGLGDLSERLRVESETRIFPQIIERLRAGNFLLTRFVENDEHGNVNYFEPVVNFRESDNAGPIDSASRLVTSVTNYQRGGIIHNIPILYAVENKRKGGLISMGYVPREHTVDGIYYQPVLVIGSEMDVGRYVPRSRIITNNKLILAQKL